MPFILDCPTGDYDSQIRHLINYYTRSLMGMGRSRIYFHIFFIILLIAEITIFSFFFTTFAEAAWISLALGLIFFTGFTYLILRLLFESQMGEHQEELVAQYIMDYQTLVQSPEKDPETHIAVANACTRFATSLKGKETRYYPALHWDRHLRSVAEEFSFLCHSDEVIQVREMLLHHSIQEHIELVKCHPTSLEFHSALANAYIVLSSLYRCPAAEDQPENKFWKRKTKSLPTLRRKFRATAKRAIEEFKIINTYAPNDPWVHQQLAYSYHDLHLPEEEIHEYETLLKLKPNDRDTLYKLGSLYLQQERNAEGLKIYEQLKSIDEHKSEELIKFYGFH